ncbi:glycosyltransferase family 2 protein [Corynebacterium liangguodongii]|uniref:Uncharacterized protein n=1 Tax=Corynebacterium liangguodongii TaxID=2079535 RepID=A0A2S0WFL5_9CORY|nr:glycosyltransferase [Corynebacterium liangguodongii]AWB84540.1 hypothetical protein C3E79_08630 [Corynebacterium liangguodongii]PWB98876.1 hypothetical protein DF219_09755 [Corynebacterium liangguodongii]
MWPDVSVIIPYYDNPAGLREVLSALRAQDYPGRVDIVVADDGSPTPASREPSLAGALAGVTVVRQEDEGFRAAAARNLGAAAGSGEVFAFIDGDTVPTPGYLTAAVARLRDDDHTVVVGRRLAGGRFAEPAWLAEGYAATGDLARADSTSWRLIISAVLTVPAGFFRELGGFDEGFRGYGGEDWEFGWRAWNAGARFVREPAALAIHPEPDFGARFAPDEGGVREQSAVKNAETIALAARITHPIARPAGVVFPTADVAVSVPEFDSPGAREAVISSWLRIDAHVYTPGPVPTLFVADPRVSEGAPGDERIRVELAGPWCLKEAEAFYRAATDASLVLGDASTVTSARARARGAAPAAATGPALGLNEAPGPIRLERLFAGW